MFLTRLPAGPEEEDEETLQPDHRVPHIVVEELEHLLRAARQVKKGDDAQQVDRLERDDPGDRADQPVAKLAREGEDRRAEQGADLDGVTARQNLDRPATIREPEDGFQGFDASIEQPDQKGAGMDESARERRDEQTLGLRRGQDAEHRHGQDQEQAQVTDGGGFEHRQGYSVIGKDTVAASCLSVM